MTQTERVLALLRSRRLRGLCSETLYRSGLPNGRNRIGELRRAGWCIRSFPCPDPHGPGYFKYVLLHERGRRCGACASAPTPKKAKPPPAMIPTGDALRAHMLGAHFEPTDDDRRRNATSEENRHFWLHYGTSGRADHDHAKPAQMRLVEVAS